MNARFLELEITGRCHCRCQHCYGSFPREGMLTKQTVMQIIDEAGEHFDCIIFSGGEPFLHPDLIELTHYAQDFVVFITTSGYSLKREQIEDLPGNVVLVFGIDGIGEVHDCYRGMKGAFEMILTSLDLARQRPKEIIATLWKGIIPQVNEIIALAEQNEALLHFNALIPVGRACANREILLSREESEMVYEKLNELRMKRGAFLVTDLYKITEKDLKGIDLFCKGRYSINPSGDVSPCEFHPCVLGNIFELSLDSIIGQAKKSDFMQGREAGFKDQVSLDLINPFNYHTEICHSFALQSGLSPR
ncbi:MAG: radical SAM protein [Thermodesulfobacteriota bacterium]|nr:radical SAM protein [Thermodesulfobacteriota bacterium]